jgi:beta-1,2-mannobiose phosphorylase / 1,2-beta-oligomannan phosphorylase
MFTKPIRSEKNPILTADKSQPWQAEAVFNGCPVKNKNQIHFLFRAISQETEHLGEKMRLSTIGYTKGKSEDSFTTRKQLILPEHQWEQFGCEDPRVTFLDGKYYIFYTALSDFPHTPAGIKIGLAVTTDFEKIDEKHQVTDFNSKAMALFPEKINDQVFGILTINQDISSSKIAIIPFENENQIWSKQYWDKWLSSINNFILPLKASVDDHLEVGAPPIKTEKGWLIVYCHIEDYLKEKPVFGIRAFLLDLKNPSKIVGQTEDPFLVPEKKYEIEGDVPNVIFPSGALVKNDSLFVYYGAADTSCCLVKTSLNDLFSEIDYKKRFAVIYNHDYPVKLDRSEKNPILEPIAKHSWESKHVKNAAAIREAGKVHILYRAMGEEKTSVIGYASTSDGTTITERLPDPVYLPREEFEKKQGEGNSGCEDPRITKIGSRFYMLYTAYNGKNNTRVAVTSIKVSDFLNKNWLWEKPILISPAGIDNKNGCIFPEKINGKYIFLHRFDPNIWIDYQTDLNFTEKKPLRGKVFLSPRSGKWDSKKVGIAGPPFKTKLGWILIYHALSKEDKKYRLGVILLDKDNPRKIVARLNYPILEPEKDYENTGLRPETVFSCGSVVIKDKLFVYYGAGDQVVCVAWVEVDRLINEFRSVPVL